MTLTEKVAYLKGLAEGLALDETTKEGKVLLAIVDLLDDLTDTVSQLDSDVDQIFDEIDAIDEAPRWKPVFKHHYKPHLVCQKQSFAYV